MMLDFSKLLRGIGAVHGLTNVAGQLPAGAYELEQTSGHGDGAAIGRFQGALCVPGLWCGGGCTRAKGGFREVVKAVAAVAEAPFVTVAG